MIKYTYHCFVGPGSSDIIEEIDGPYLAQFVYVEQDGKIRGNTYIDKDFTFINTEPEYKEFSYDSDEVKDFCGGRFSYNKAAKEVLIKIGFDLPIPCYNCGCTKIAFKCINCEES